MLKEKNFQNEIIFTNGCFDILHSGHLHVLRSAKRLGGRLVVGLNSDSSITKLKGSSRPIMNENDRRDLLQELRCVDDVIIFNEETPYNLIQRLRPKYLVKGGDYLIDEIVGGDFVLSYGGHVEIVEYLEGTSTSSMIEKLRTIK